MKAIEQFCKTFGLHPLVGMAFVVADLLFTIPDVIPPGWLISAAIGGTLTIPYILLQRYGHKDAWGEAIGKGLILGCLTAIPYPVSSLLAVGSGNLMKNKQLGTSGDAIEKVSSDAE